MKTCPAPLSGLLCLLMLALLARTASAQASCASDGQPRPTALLERFIHADCADCWVDARTARARSGELPLDWVLPGSRGEDAALSAVAVRDAEKRLRATGLGMPASSTSRSLTVQPLATSRLRVARGPVLSGYAGASIGFKPGRTAHKGAAWTAWLVLIEQLPKGTEGSPVARNLVRNALQVQWSGQQPEGFLESRVMSVPAGAQPARLGLVGWVEDGQGRIVSAVRARCLGTR